LWVKPSNRRDAILQWEIGVADVIRFCEL
jgi:hypothetical protein